MTRTRTSPESFCGRAGVAIGGPSVQRQLSLQCRGRPSALEFNPSKGPTSLNFIPGKTALALVSMMVSISLFDDGLVDDGLLPTEG
jgi:hypothetical protein